MAWCCYKTASSVYISTTRGANGTATTTATTTTTAVIVELWQLILKLNNNLYRRFGNRKINVRTDRILLSFRRFD